MARKRILVIENDLPIRTAVERILRQQGHEVVGVDTVRRAEGLLSVTGVDLALIGSGVVDGRGKIYYTTFSSGPGRTTPFLALAPHSSPPADLPSEVVISCPFTAEELVASVRVFLGSCDTDEISDDSPFAGDSKSEDDMLDAALGLDRIEVTESETFKSEDTTQARRAARKSDATFAPEGGNDTVTTRGVLLTDTARIDLALAANKSTVSEQVKKSSKGDKLDVAPTGTFPVTSSVPSKSKSSSSAPSNPAEHDYDWLVSEMTRESGPQAKPASPKNAAPTEAPSLLRKAPEGVAAKASRNPSAQPAEDVIDWSDTAPSPIDPSVFSRELIDKIAQQVAEQIATRLNTEKLHALIIAELRRALAEQS